jgi:hypothetical protein
VIYVEYVTVYQETCHRGDVEIAHTIHLAFGGLDDIQVIMTALCHCNVIDSDEVRQPPLLLDSVRRRAVLQTLEWPLNPPSSLPAPL